MPCMYAQTCVYMIIVDAVSSACVYNICIKLVTIKEVMLCCDWAAWVCLTAATGPCYLCSLLYYLSGL